jgi:hypothetical protein
MKGILLFITVLLCNYLIVQISSVPHLERKVAWCNCLEKVLDTHQ